VLAGEYAYVSGQVPVRDGKPAFIGKLGAAISIEDGQEAARLCALNGLAALSSSLGSLDRVTRVLKLTAFVASAEGFTEQPQVANGASQLLIDLFGHNARPARAAVGVAELPGGVPVEVEMIALVQSQGRR
jgi:enamine deaminase RidA (YjgF/YER057c/UK114 family)